MFETKDRVAPGSRLVLERPPSFVGVKCAGFFLRRIAFPTASDCVDPEEEGEDVVITINSTLPAGSYAVSITVQTPSFIDPEDAVFSLILQSSTGKVYDAAIGLVGPPIIENLMARASSLYWSSAFPGDVATLEAGFTLEEKPPATREISSILVSLPSGFSHAISTEADVETFTSDPNGKWVASGRWLTYGEPGRFRVEVVPSNLTRNEYKMRFPVLIPPVVPARNVWMVSLCGIDSTTGERCFSYTDRAAFLTWPIAGFEIGEVHYSHLGRIAAGGAGLTSWHMLLWILPGILLDWQRR
mmetsp:Transcript_11515/g.25583  ORF Transcript_11515/g.25583 Transcript_11515/m.25583 type:complete len:300 (-) Transcript_11515:48-947(-)